MPNNFSSSSTSPPNGISLPIIHKIAGLYKNFYNLRKNINKTNRYGLYLKIEELILEILQVSMEAALSSSPKKFLILQKLRLKIEIAKRLIRIMLDLKIITTSKYISLQTDLQEISKMATGWQKYLINKEP